MLTNNPSAFNENPLHHSSIHYNIPLNQHHPAHFQTDHHIPGIHHFNVPDVHQFYEVQYPHNQFHHGYNPYSPQLDIHPHNVQIIPQAHFILSEPSFQHPINVVAHPMTATIQPSDLSDNHDHIQQILEKLRSMKHEATAKLKLHDRSKRSFFSRSFFGDSFKTPTLESNVFIPKVVTNEDRWLTGCLLQCIFSKSNAVDINGYPTLDGLTGLYTAGTSDHLFFLHALRTVDKCLKSISIKYHIFRGKIPVKGETCDVAFEVFDCVSHSITEHCSY